MQSFSRSRSLRSVATLLSLTLLILIGLNRLLEQAKADAPAGYEAGEPVGTSGLGAPAMGL